MTVFKRSLMYFLPLWVLVTISLTVIWLQKTHTERIILETGEFRMVDSQKRALLNDLRLILSDLMILAAHHEFEIFFEKGETHAWNNLSEEFLVFGEKKGIYDQLRFIDETGMEVIRVNYNNGRPYLVPKERRQSKSQRYYFQNTIPLEREEIYISPFDLNVERGEVEQPMKPMIRFCTPIYDEQGNQRGIVVLNYLGNNLLHHFADNYHKNAGRMMLLNTKGFWLHAPNPEDEWGFMFKDGMDKTFGNAFPHAWQRISEEISGQFNNAEGRFTFATLYPILELQDSIKGTEKIMNQQGTRHQAKESYWKIVSHCPPGLANEKVREFLVNFLLPVYGIVLLVLVVSCWMISHLVIKRRRSEEEVRKLFVAVSQNPNMVLMADIGGKIDYANLAFEKITGYERMEIIDRDMRVLMSDQCDESFYREMWDTVNAGKAWTRQMTSKKKSGDLYDEEMTVSPVHNDRGHITHFIIIKRDISEEEKLRKELIRTEKLSSMGTFISGVAHELNNPLTSVLGFSEILLEDENIRKEAKDLVQGILEQAKRSKEIVHNLSECSKIYSPHKAPLKIHDLLDEVLDLKNKPLQADNIRVHTDYGPEIPLIIGNVNHLHRAFANIIENAYKAMLDNHKKGTLSIETSRQGVVVRTIFENDGPQIPQEVLSKIFDPFFTTREVGKGAGLGLSVAYGIIRDHKGEIIAENIQDDSPTRPEGTGVRFTIDLPSIYH